MKNNMTHISSVLDSALENFRVTSDTEMIRIWKLWDEAVGDTIARNAKPGAFKKDILLVHVSSSVWMQQLRFLKQDLISRINFALGQELVREIRFKIANLHA
ncbi:MAG: DUF721 domain-containing protein [Thermodesulfobacteriota bacterium]|nr:DUF721 domain-containing protein [Thermodesulfobacteriota bacterium]